VLELAVRLGEIAFGGAQLTLLRHDRAEILEREATHPGIGGESEDLLEQRARLEEVAAAEQHVGFGDDRVQDERVELGFARDRLAVPRGVEGRIPLAARSADVGEPRQRLCGGRGIGRARRRGEQGDGAVEIAVHLGANAVVERIDSGRAGPRHRRFDRRIGKHRAAVGRRRGWRGVGA
jgi:hypothetical protein